MSVKIGHARGRNGISRNNQVTISDWYSAPWLWMAVAKSATVREKHAQFIEAGCNNNKIMYHQSYRNTLRDQLKSLDTTDPSKVTKDCYCDCVSFQNLGINVSLGSSLYSGNGFTVSSLKSWISKSSKYKFVTTSKYLSSSYCVRGAIYGSSGHTMCGLTNGGSSAKMLKSLGCEASISSSSSLLTGGTTDGSVQEMDLRMQFIVEALGRVGDGPSWTYKKTGQKEDSVWCASFIDACARQVGQLSNVLIPKGVWGAGSIVKTAVQKGYGKYYEGPYLGGKDKPIAGDLVLYRYTDIGGDKYNASSVGIVYSYVNSTVTSIEADYGTSSSPKKREVALRSMKDTNHYILGYFRPKWSKVGASVKGNITDVLSDGEDLYDDATTREDSIVREISYWDLSKSKPVTSSTDVRCSVINYTTVLGAFFKSGIGTGVTSSSDGGSSADLSGLSGSGLTGSRAKTIIKYLTGKGLNTAGAVGICANIYAESGYRTYTGGSFDGQGSEGICQWTYDRKTRMINYVGSNWKTNLSGQLDYLWYELNHGYKTGTLNPIKKVSNTKSGAKKAAKIFVDDFERCADKYKAQRQEYAAQLWDAIA